MAADTSSPPATITLLVEPAAAALASLSDDPMPATSAAAAANMSGAAITYDIVDLRPESSIRIRKCTALPARYFSVSCVCGRRQRRHSKVLAMRTHSAVASSAGARIGGYAATCTQPMNDSHSLLWTSSRGRFKERGEHSSGHCELLYVAGAVDIWLWRSSRPVRPVTQSAMYRFGSANMSRAPKCRGARTGDGGVSDDGQAEFVMCGSAPGAP